MQQIPVRPPPAVPCRRILWCALFLAALFSGPVPGPRWVHAQVTPAQVGTWARELKNGDDRDRREAARSLSLAGDVAADAVPALVQALEDDEQQVWFFSITALANLGPLARDAVPALLEDLDPSRVNRGQRRYFGQTRYRTAYALGRIGEAAVPGLVEALQNGSGEVRAGAVMALGWAGTAAVPQRGALARLLADPDDEVRAETVAALGRLGPPVLEVIPDFLHHTSANARAAAADALAALGSSGAGLESNLWQAWDGEKEEAVRARQLRALARIGADPDRLAVVAIPLALQTGEGELPDMAFTVALEIPEPERRITPRLMEALRSGPPKGEANRALDLLGRLGPAAAEAIPDLIQRAVVSSDAESGDTPALQALVRIGPTAVPNLLDRFQSIPTGELDESHRLVGALAEIGPGLIPDLLTALNSKSESVRLGATLAMGRLGSLAARARRPLAARPLDVDPNVRAAMLTTLASIGAEPAQMLPTIEAGLQDEVGVVRAAAARAAARMQGPVENLVPALTVALDDPDPEVRQSAVRAMGAAGPAAREAVPRLLDLLKHSRTADERVVLAGAFGRIGPDAADAVPALIQLLDDTAAEVRLEGIRSLGRIGRPAGPALDRMESVVQSGTVEERAEVLEAWGRIAPDFGRLEPVLRRTLEDESRSLRAAAARTAGRLGGAAAALAPELEPLLDEDATRGAGLDALRRTGIRSVEVLIRLSEHEDPAVRAFACESMGRRRDARDEVVPALRRSMRDSYDFVRQTARDALRRLDQR